MRVGRAGWATLVAAVVGWTAWTLTVLGVPPTAPGAQGAFYLSLLLALPATGALLLALAAQRREGRRASRGTLFYWPHAFVGSFLLLFALWLQSLRMLTLPNGLLLLALFALIEGASSLVSRRHYAD